MTLTENTVFRITYSDLKDHPEGIVLNGLTVKAGQDGLFRRETKIGWEEKSDIVDVPGPFTVSGDRPGESFLFTPDPKEEKPSTYTFNCFFDGTREIVITR